jgi:predicted Zn-ribbon and HTH transcriptional regulator
MRGDVDTNRELMVDGNAVAGTLRSLFGREMTVAPARCAHCGTVSEIGALLAFTQHKPAVVLRCPACEKVVMRISPTPRGTFVDLRGASYVRLGGERER